MEREREVEGGGRWRIMSKAFTPRPDPLLLHSVTGARWDAAPYLPDSKTSVVFVADVHIKRPTTDPRSTG